MASNDVAPRFEGDDLMDYFLGKRPTGKTTDSKVDLGNIVREIDELTFVLLSKSGNFSLVLAISLFVAGGISNLIDRLMHNGTVVDFLNVGIGPIRTGIFNIADVAIMAGSALLFFTTLRKQKEKRSPGH